MPATSKKVTTKAAAKKIDALAEGIRKVRAANAAKAAKAKPAAKAATKAVQAAKAPAATTKPAKAAKAATASAKPAATGAKQTVIAMIAEAGKVGVSAAEIAKKLGWPRAGGTISRAIKLAGFKVAKARDAEGVLRYSRA